MEAWIREKELLVSQGDLGKSRALFKRAQEVGSSSQDRVHMNDLALGEVIMKLEG